MHIYIYIYIYMHIYKYACICIHLNTYMHNYKHICIYIHMHIYTHLFIHTYILIYTWGCPRGVMVKAMDCGIVVREFVLQSRCYIHFRANTLGKGMNPLILPPAMG